MMTAPPARAAGHCQDFHDHSGIGTSCPAPRPLQIPEQAHAWCKIPPDHETVAAEAPFPQGALRWL
jgi:hypothetical protein